MVHFVIQQKKHVITQLKLAYKDALLPDKYLQYTN